MTISKRGLLDLIFPVPCTVCGQFSEDICPKCLLDIPKIRMNVCPGCERIIDNNNFCPKCRSQFHPIKKLIHLGDFDNPVLHKAICGLKYNERKHIAATLGAILANRIKDTRFDFDVLVPIPIHKSRLRKRGYNQSEEIVIAIAQVTQKPILLNLIKIKETEPQASLNKVQREKNVIGCFAVINSSEFAGKNVLLIDDVITTGTTLKTAGEVLKRVGAKKIFAATLAREF